MMMEKENYGYRFADIPLVQLKPKTSQKKFRDKKTQEKTIRRIRSSIETVGLLEVFHVYPIGENRYEINDGNIRYYILLDMGVESVPCLIYDTPDLYTTTRQINHLSPIEETKMINKALQEVDAERIAKVFGIKNVAFHLKPSLLNRLHPTIIQAITDGMILKSCAIELGRVTPERQLEIFALMQNAKNFSLSFAKIQILKTKPQDRNKLLKRNPWQEHQARKKSLLAQLKEIEEEHDHYAGLYRQYTTDLMLAAIYVREILAKEKLENYLHNNMSPILCELREIIEKIINETN